MPCRFRGCRVVVNLQAAPLADTARVEEDVAHALYTYLNPLVGGYRRAPATGWPFGRALNQGELYGVVHAVDGVEFVKILRIYETNLETGEQSAKPAGTHIVLEPDELIASGHAHRQGRRTAKTMMQRPTRLEHGSATGRSRADAASARRRLRLAAVGATRDAARSPPRARTCANGLPSIYQDGDFGMRFVGALEELLDPIVACSTPCPPLRSRPRAARHPRAARRVAGRRPRRVAGPTTGSARLVRRAAELGRRRGTAAGLELALELASPTCPLRVEDEGGVTWSTRPERLGEGAAAELRRLLRQADPRADPARRRALIEQYKPVHVALPPAGEGRQEAKRRRPPP